MATDEKNVETAGRTSRRPSIFISYRREDTSGEAGHLAADLGKRFGRERIFIDVDALAPGQDFEAQIDHVLSACHVTLVLIGKRWLTVSLPDGSRRIDGQSDYVRKEIATALRRPDMSVVPVLVEGTTMPTADELPADIADLARHNAFELSNKRWGYDVGQLCGAIERNVSRLSRLLRRPMLWVAAVGAVVIAVVAALVVMNAGSTHGNGTNGRRGILVPATVQPAVDECTHQLETAVDGTGGPLKCAGNRINVLAWQYYAKFDPLVMALGRYATEGQVAGALCADLKNSSIGTIPKEVEAYQVSALYYGWKFVIPPTAGDTIDC